MSQDTSTPRGDNPQADELRQLASVRTALLDEFGGRLSEERVEQLFQASVSSFAGASIRSFVPLLAQRSVRQELQRALAGAS